MLVNTDEILGLDGWAAVYVLGVVMICGYYNINNNTHVIIKLSGVGCMKTSGWSDV